MNQINFRDAQYWKYEAPAPERMCEAVGIFLQQVTEIQDNISKLRDYVTILRNLHSDILASLIVPSDLLQTRWQKTTEKIQNQCKDVKKQLHGIGTCNTSDPSIDLSIQRTHCHRLKTDFSLAMREFNQIQKKHNQQKRRLDLNFDTASKSSNESLTLQEDLISLDERIEGVQEAFTEIHSVFLEHSNQFDNIDCTVEGTFSDEKKKTLLQKLKKYRIKIKQK